MQRPKPIQGFKKFVQKRRPAINEVVREPTAGGIVFRRGVDKQLEILLIQDAKDRWTIPKGHVEEGETTKQTAEREIKEETGLQEMEVMNWLGKINFRYRRQQSLVLMDEIGRGTSTFDGLSLAFACAEYLAQKIQAYTLFATHYFELTALQDDIAAVKNVHLDAAEHGDKIIFLHKVQPGPASQSYGIQVAQLAGVPRSVIQQAKKKLQALEQQAYQQYAPAKLQGDLFASVVEDEPAAVLRLRAIDPDQLTPKEALEVLYQLRAEV